MDLLTTLGILADEFHLVTHTVDGEVACLGQRLEDVDLLVADGEHTRPVDFTEDGNLVVGHTHRDNGGLCLIQIGLDLIVEQFLAHGLGETADFQTTDDGIVDKALVVDQIGLEDRLGIGAPRLVVERGGNRQVKRCGSIRVDRVDGDGQNVLGHDAGIIEVF